MSNVAMMMPTPNQTPPSGSEYVLIAGQQWPVPKLAVRQFRVIVPGIVRLLRELGPMFAMTLDAKAGKISPADLVRQFHLSTEQIDLLGDIILCALQRAHSNMTHDQFQEMEITLQEMMGALPVIMRQAGLFDNKEAAQTGEAIAGSLTGTV